MLPAVIEEHGATLVTLMLVGYAASDALCRPVMRELLETDDRFAIGPPIAVEAKPRARRAPPAPTLDKAELEAKREQRRAAKEAKRAAEFRAQRGARPRRRRSAGKPCTTRSARRTTLEEAAMLDSVIRGGTVVDGTGAPARQADVGIRDGRIVEIGKISDDAAETIDADGLVVAPGFVDPHTHYDAQLFWDPAATPSNLHGVTSMIAGNCGFTLAPVKPEDADYLRRMMAKVEGMPLPALETGVPWSWRSFGEYLDAVDDRVGLNVGFLVGHCALRRNVMGAEAIGNEATPEQLAAMTPPARGLDRGRRPRILHDACRSRTPTATANPSGPAGRRTKKCSSCAARCRGTRARRSSTSRAVACAASATKKSSRWPR